MISISRILAKFCGLCAVRIIIFVLISTQVLAIERRTPNKAGQQGQPQQWYEKGWKQSGTKSDTVYIDDGRSQRSRMSEGSGDRGGVSDLDDTASGYGEDDEDSDVERGSGDHSRVGGVFGGSGDEEIGLPPRQTVKPPTLVGEDTIGSWTSTSLSTTTVTSAHLLPVTQSTTNATTSKPFIGPVLPVEITTSRPRYIVDTTSTSSARVVTTSSALYTMRQTTTTQAIIRQRPTTTTTMSTQRAPIVTTSKEISKLSPKMIPPMLEDDRNKTMGQNFWMRPGVLAGLIGGAVAGLLAAILLVIFVVYRMRKKDEGSYALEEPKSPPAYTYAYQKAPTREFYA